MAKKISAILSNDLITQRATFQLVEPNPESNDFTEAHVLVTTRESSVGFYKVSRFNGGKFSRDWVRQYADACTAQAFFA